MYVVRFRQTLFTVHDAIRYRDSFRGDVALDSFTMASRDEDNILYQIYKKYVWIFMIMIMNLVFHNIIGNAYITLEKYLNPIL